MTFGAAALCAAVSFADVESANVVGYQTLPIKQSEIKMFSVQFDKVDGNPIPVKDLVSCTDFKGSSGFNNSADQIWTYKNGEWTKYMYYAKTTTKEWRLSDAKTKVPDTATLTSGDAFFFQRSKDGSDTTLTLAGGVAPLTVVKPVPVAQSAIVMLANPWPTSLQLNQFDKLYDNVKGSSGFNNSADQIWTYKNGNWTKYMYYAKTTTKEWRLSDAKTAVQDIVTIEPGEGFFFQRSKDGADTVINFKGPDYKD